MAFSIHTIYAQIFKVWRKRRFEVFLNRIGPRETDVLLDVGGYPGSWTSCPQPVARVDTLNLDVGAPPYACPSTHNIRVLVGDGCALTMADGSYDIGFSNSVIEHVGSRQQQQQFASEIRRVAKALWVQTPAYECPIEPHYLAPVIHYLPPKLQRRVMRWCTGWGWIERPSQEQIDKVIASTQLLRKAEFEQLFPDCEILTERMFWLVPKSYIAIRVR